MGYRYIGSKDKLAHTLIELMLQKCPHAHSVIDLMAGTGLFSLALRKSGFRVLASDVMTYSFHHLVVNLKLNSAPSFNGLNSVLGEDCDYSKVISYLNQLNPVDGFFVREYSPAGIPQEGCKSRKYFTYP